MSLLIKNFTKHKIQAAALENVMTTVLLKEKVKRVTEVSLVFTGEKRIRTLNRKYRSIDRVTDVLSFEGENDDSFIDPNNGISYMGEVFICYKRAEKQAREKGHGVKKEIDILFIHGLLHLLGYDHIKDADYEKMRRKEETILKKLYG